MVNLLFTEDWGTRHPRVFIPPDTGRFHPDTGRFQHSPAGAAIRQGCAPSLRSPPSKTNKKQSQSVSQRLCPHSVRAHQRLATSHIRLRARALLRWPQNGCHRLSAAGRVVQLVHHAMRPHVVTHLHRQRRQHGEGQAIVGGDRVQVLWLVVAAVQLLLGLLGFGWAGAAAVARRRWSRRCS